MITKHIFLTLGIFLCSPLFSAVRESAVTRTEGTGKHGQYISYTNGLVRVMYFSKEDLYRGRESVPLAGIFRLTQKHAKESYQELACQWETQEKIRAATSGSENNSLSRSSSQK